MKHKANEQETLVCRTYVVAKLEHMKPQLETAITLFPSPLTHARLQVHGTPVYCSSSPV